MHSPFPPLLVLVIIAVSAIPLIFHPTLLNFTPPAMVAILLYFLYRTSASKMELYQKQLTSLEGALSLVSSTIESTVDGVFVVDKQAKITKHNHRFDSMWKIPPEILNTRDQDQVLNFIQSQLIDSGDFTKKIDEIHQLPDTESLEIIHLKDNRVFEAYSIPQHIKGEVVGRVWNFHDITVRKRQEDMLQENIELLKLRTRELEKTSQLMIDREVRMNELKKQIQKLETGQMHSFPV